MKCGGLAVRLLWFGIGAIGMIGIMTSIDINHIKNGRDPQFLRDDYYIKQGLL